MKRIPVAAIVLFLIAIGGCSGGDIEKKGLVRLSRHCYAFIAEGPSSMEGLGSNSGFVVGERGVLVVDSRFTPGLAGELLDAVRSVTDRPILFLVNTHYHPDHTWGNAVFKREGAVVVAGRGTGEALVRYSPVYKEYYRDYKPGVYAEVKDVEVVPPDTVVSGRMLVDLGGVEVAIEHKGPAHTAGDCIVSVPLDGVVYTGGILVNRYHPNMGDVGADYDRWVGVLEEMMGMDVRHFVPAQGFVCGKSTVRRNIEYITELEKRCIDLMEGGKPLKVALKELSMPGTEGYLQSNLLPFNIQAVYRREALRVVDPPFRMDWPGGFSVMDGAGSRKSGMMRWAADDGDGYREIEVRWGPTYLKEVILQDVSNRVSRFLEGNREYRMDIARKGRVTVGGAECPYVEGRWAFRREARREGGGLWGWLLAIDGGTLYSIRIMTDAGMDRDLERRNIEELKSIAATIRRRP